MSVQDQIKSSSDEIVKQIKIGRKGLKKKISDLKKDELISENWHDELSYLAYMEKTGKTDGFWEDTKAQNLNNTLYNANNDVFRQKYFTVFEDTGKSAMSDKEYKDFWTKVVAPVLVTYNAPKTAKLLSKPFSANPLVLLAGGGLLFLASRILR